MCVCVCVCACVCVCVCVCVLFFAVVVAVDVERQYTRKLVERSVTPFDPNRFTQKPHLRFLSDN